MFSTILAMGTTVTNEAAAGAGQATGSSSMLMTIGMVVVFIGLMYLLMIRPQKKREKEAQKMLSALKRGDKVVTIGGIRGKVVAVRNDSVILKIDSNAKMEISKSAISSVLAQSSGNYSAKDTKDQEVIDAPTSDDDSDKLEDKTESESSEDKSEFKES